MITMRSKWGGAFLLCAPLMAASLAGCSTEYHGYDSGIDGVLWRQIADFEDPLSQQLSQSSATEPLGYLDALTGTRWDGTTAAPVDLDAEEGGVVLYDISSTGSTAQVSVFIASGPRPDVPTDAGRTYSGPSQVFTCYGVETDSGAGKTPMWGRQLFDKCPTALVDLLPDDAAFASDEVFDG